MATCVNIPFNVVKKTPFEELADKIKADNEVRDRHISCLERIMTAYSYIMCVLEASPRRITIDDINTVNNFIDNVLKEKNVNTQAATRKDSIFYSENYFTHTYLWANIAYWESKEGGLFRSRGDDVLLKKSLYWNDWRQQTPESQKSFSLCRLQEDLWDVEKMLFRYDKLPDFVKNYPWAFPPNVAELHKQLVEMKTKAAA